MKQLYLLIMLACAVSLKGQENLALKAGNHISYTGYYVHLLPEFRTERFSVYAGPGLAISEMKFPHRGPFALNGGLRVLPGRWTMVRSYAELTYQLVRYNAHGTESMKKIAVHEYLLGTGILWNISSRAGLEGGIYAGRYSEKWPGFYTGESEWHSGYDSMVRLSFNYSLK